MSKLRTIYSYRGYFRSKRGTGWHYSVSSTGFVEMWHPTTVRCTGGWKTGPDARPSKITKECFDEIKKDFELERDPECDYAVIIQDHRMDELLDEYISESDDYAATFKTCDGKIRIIVWCDSYTARRIKTVDSVENVDEFFQHQWKSWKKV